MIELKEMEPSEEAIVFGYMATLKENLIRLFDLKRLSNKII
jgi:hypothetical protein